MSLFNREEKTKEIKRDNKFKIFQFIKVEGLKSVKKEKFVPTEFVSSVFGRVIKDETVAPHVNVNTGDKVKQYDFIRKEPKGDLSTYDEFGSVILTSDSRKEYFGEDAYVDKTKTAKAKNRRIKEFDIPFTGKEKEETFVDAFSDYNSGFEEVMIKEPVFEKQPVYEEPINNIENIEKPVVHEIPAFIPKPEKPKIYEPEKYQEVPVEEKDIPFTPPRPTIQQQPVNRRKYVFPSPDMFSKVSRDQHSRPQWLTEQEEAINRTLKEFNVQGKVANIVKGPTVTRHEIELEPGVNVRSVSSIENNLKMNLAAETIRIEAPIPGKPYVGLEVPNKVPEIVAFGNVISDPEFINSKKPLTVALGVDIDGENIFADIQKMPHGLIAGQTNSGKSVCVNTIIMSLLLKNHPDDLKFILIDPKKVELAPYSDIPHLATPVIDDPKMASTALNWAVLEMDKRFEDFANARVRDLQSYNEKALTDDSLTKKPFIVIVIDELADLMMVSSQDVEHSIQRLAQKARAAGIHLLVATQRPTKDVVSGNIKANIPTRIAFSVASFVDSTTIIDTAGAEQLLGRGDMLYKPQNRSMRLQGAYIKDSEIDKATEFIRNQMEPNYIIDSEELKSFQVQKDFLSEDELMKPVIEFIVEEGEASINKLTNKFEIGFNRAQRIIEALEAQGIVSGREGTKPRKVLITKGDLE